MADFCVPILAEELSEEDQQLKNELDMLVERLTVGDPHVVETGSVRLADQAPRKRTCPSTNQL